MPTRAAARQAPAPSPFSPAARWSRSRRTGMSDLLDALPAGERALLKSGAVPTTAGAMLATLTEDRFSDPGWIYERKLDGVRCVARRGTDGQVRLLSRNDKIMTGTYPEVADALAAHSAHEVVIDG